MSKKKKNAARPESGQNPLETPGKPAQVQAEKPVGKAPAFDKAEIGIVLTARLHRVGMEVYSRYRAQFKGSFPWSHRPAI